MKKTTITVIILLIAIAIFAQGRREARNENRRSHDSQENSFEAIFGENVQALGIGASPIGKVLGEGDEHWFSVRANQSGFLIVQTTGSTDTYMMAYDSQRNLIMQNDDGGEGLNARIELRVDAREHYLFMVRGYSEYSTGSYAITALNDPLPRPTLLSFGAPRRDSLPPRGSNWYSVNTTEISVLLIQISAETGYYWTEIFDAQFNLLQVLGHGDMEYFAAANQIYIVRIREYDGDPMDNYTITVYSNSLADMRGLTLGEPHSGFIHSNDSLWFSARTRDNGILSVYTTGDIDTYLYVFDDDFQEIRSAGEGGLGQNAMVTLTAEANKTFYIRLRTWEWASSGNFNIIAENVSVTDLRSGVSHRSFLQPNMANWYKVYSPEVAFVSVQTTGQLDTFMEYFNEELYLYDSDDDSGDGVNALINVFAESENLMYFRVRSFKEGVSGEYNIIAALEGFPEDIDKNTDMDSAINLPIGTPTTIYFHHEYESRWYRLDNSHIVGANFEVFTRGSLDTMLVFYDFQGNILAQDDDGGEGLNALISQLLDTGIYYVEVKTWGGRIGRSTLFSEMR